MDIPLNDGDDLIESSSGSDLGNIQINHEVVASIVAIAAREVPGVAGLTGGSFREDLKGFLGGKRETGMGVTVNEDEHGRYEITLRIVVNYGLQLARIAQDVQLAVRQQVEVMTGKLAYRVHVIVDGIRQPEPANRTEQVL